jgi:PPIC-type peptidyl-prolyl cis-trans isomerase-like protein
MAKSWWVASVIGMSGWLTGCAQLPDFAIPTESLARNISQPGAAQTRGQMGDAPKPIRISNPQPLDVIQAKGTDLSKQTPIQQASFANRGTVSVQVSAWVNGRPIFEAEVQQQAGPEQMRLPPGMSAAEASKRIAEIREAAIEQIIDQELIFQDAIKKLEKAAPQALEKLKEFVDQESDKTMDNMRKKGAPESAVREVEPTLRRMLERNIVSSEYARSRIKGIIETRIGLIEIREYYETHLNEFMSEDRVDWQDVFIPLNQNQRTIEDLKRFAEELLNRCRTPDDFKRLVAYDSLGKNGEGLGHRRGEIRPAELEEMLFKLPVGVPGPVVAFPTGVHLIQVNKREVKGQIPLNEVVTKTIKKRLERELYEREYRRIVRELRARSVWRIERDS